MEEVILTTKIKSVRYRCDICGTEYTSLAETKLCEVRGITLPKISVGDEILLTEEACRFFGVTDNRAHVRIRCFNFPWRLSHNLCVADYGVRYEVMLRENRLVTIIDANSVNLRACGEYFCRSWFEFFNQANTGKLGDTEGLEELRIYINIWLPGLNL